MIKEKELFKIRERVLLPREQIDCFTLPDDQYDDETFARYFSVYAGIAHKYRPKRIFEIGVRYGCTAICMMLGLPAGSDVIYRGIDDESQWADSCARANRNFQEQVPWANARCLRHNAFSGLPDEVKGLAPYDLIHIDGLHAYNAVSNELRMCWPILAEQGIIMLDDADTPEVHQAVEEFLGVMKEDPTVRVDWQYSVNLRNHTYLQKVAI